MHVYYDYVRLGLVLQFENFFLRCNSLQLVASLKPTCNTMMYI